ncbi:MAG: phenylalanine--tRNA ligase subunit alpha [Chlamydiales bacterium]|nr:phenylalanine--tRNA ligase subunit alpha [Chlamydiales bacterium]
MESISNLRHQFQADLSKASTSQDVEALRIRYLGRKSPVQDLMKSLKDCSEEERPKAGKLINELKQEIATAIEAVAEQFYNEELDKRLKNETIDVTEPGRKRFLGRAHPISQMIDEITDVLKEMGFSIQLSPEIETEFYNYWGLNFPPDHPALDMQDTFYIDKDLLLRSHTTNIQQRIMESQIPPIRIASPGKCYRNETITSRSHVLFHQVDVFYVDMGVTMSDLLATLETFYSKIFHKNVNMRTRASYFPFVEPGIEVDIQCTACGGTGCRLCKDTGWLEVCGAGMVHPEVLKQGGIDPETYSGFAWGGGVERLFMLRHGVRDIRQFTDNDVRFLKQF